MKTFAPFDIVVVFSPAKKLTLPDSTPPVNLRYLKSANDCDNTIPADGIYSCSLNIVSKYVGGE